MLGALILPRGPRSTGCSRSPGSTPSSPTVEVIVNEEDPVKAQLVDDRIHGADHRGEPEDRPARSPSLRPSTWTCLLEGGELRALLGRQRSTSWGSTTPERSWTQSQGAAATAPMPPKQLDRGDRVRRAGEREPRLRGAAAGRGGAADRGRQGAWSPARAPTLDTFAISVAATMTLMFVTVLLVAGSLALEREENAFPRLTRGLVEPGALLGEKVLLGIVVSLRRDAADARRARALRLDRLGADSGAGSRRDRRRRRRVRGLRRRARRGGPRGPRRLAARVHGLAADRVPLARPVGHRRRRRSST